MIDFNVTDEELEALKNYKEKNTEEIVLLLGKFSVGKQIQDIKDKLEALKQAQRDFGDYSSLTDEQKAKYNQLSVEIAKTENIAFLIRRKRHLVS